MPFISFNTSCKLSAEQKTDIKANFGQLIAILPTKNESYLMLDIADGHTMYNAGAAKERCAFVDVRLYGQSGAEYKNQFVAEMTQMLQDKLGIEPKDVYVNFIELNSWGSGGAYIEK